MGFLKITLYLILFFLLIMSWLSFGDHGFIHLYRMEEEREATLDRIKRLNDENQELWEEIERLRTDQDYIELMARRELGLIKDDEILYRFTRGKDNH